MFIPDSKESAVPEFLNKIHPTGPQCPACEMLLQKKKKKGLWAGNFEMPWEWRKKRK